VESRKGSKQLLVPKEALVHNQVNIICAGSQLLGKQLKYLYARLNSRVLLFRSIHIHLDN